MGLLRNAKNPAFIDLVVQNLGAELGSQIPIHKPDKILKLVHFLNNGVLRCHDLDSVGVSEGHNSFETLGDHGDGAHKSDVDRWEGFTLEGIGVKEGSEECCQTHGTDADEKVLGDHIDLLQYISLDSLGLVNKTVDGTDLCEISSGDSNSDSASLSNKSG